MNQPDPVDSVASRIIERLTDFTEKLERGEPVPATQVTRIETPDGPMHERKDVTLQSDPADADLPRLVALAMGWTESHNGKVWNDATTGCLCRKDCWRPHEDWNQMGQVIAWLESKGFAVFTRSKQPDTPCPEGKEYPCLATIKRGGAEWVSEHGWGPTLPLALCRAVVQLKESGLI